MTAEAKCIVLRLDADHRFAVGIGGAVRCLAEAAGMSEEVCREFQTATVNACLESFRTDASAQHRVELCRFADRIEVAVHANAATPEIRITRRF